MAIGCSVWTDVPRDWS